MKYGLIGEKLGHSYSKVIHEALGCEYELCEVKKEDFDSFARMRDFKAVNVTIPYKQTVIPYLYCIDAQAERIGAVNAVVNRDGQLYGYNTDFYGMKLLIEKIGVPINGKKVIILGTGGTSKTAAAVSESLGAKEILRVSRSGKDGAVTYEELYENHRDAEFLINTTPSGMYPNIFDIPVDISRLPNLSGVLDAIYNPLRTPLILAAKERNIPAEGGLYMLVGQAVRASEIFLDKEYPENTLPEIYENLRREKENIVLIGMPASGKSTVGKILSERLGRELVDTDELIVKKAGMEIPEIFKSFGEKYFRDLESEVIREVSARNSIIIATGGGAVLRPENVRALKLSGRLFFIDRPPQALVPTDTRPLSSDRAAIEKRFAERYNIYCTSADVRIDANCEAERVAEKIGNSI